MLGMSQEKLGENLGITFQQIQKYEKGTNRVGASRLQAISEILGVPVSFLFEDAPGHELRLEVVQQGQGDERDDEAQRAGDGEFQLVAHQAGQEGVRMDAVTGGGGLAHGGGSSPCNYPRTANPMISPCRSFLQLYCNKETPPMSPFHTAFLRAAVAQQNESIRRQNVVVTNQNDVVRIQNESLRKLVAERDEVVRLLNERTELLNKLNAGPAK